jgi:hypothetical protein
MNVMNASFLLISKNRRARLANSRAKLAGERVSSLGWAALIYLLVLSWQNQEFGV